MIIHLSILFVIVVTALMWEGKIRRHKTLHLLLNEPYDYKSDLTPWLVVFGYIAFLAAMRTRMNDTIAYVWSFIYNRGSWSEIKYLLRYGDSRYVAFEILSNLFKMYISNDYHLWFGFVAVIESIIFIKVLRREAVSFLDACFFFFASSLYYNYFSMMRQWLAVAIVFSGTKYLKQRKFIPYLIICIIAAAFHPSAYIMIPIYFVVQGRAWSKNQFVLIVLATAGIFFVNPILSAMEGVLEGTTYDYALEDMTSGSGSSIIRAAIAAVPVVIAYVDRHRMNENNRMINICVNMAMINLLLNLLASLTSGLYVVRLATYVAMYNVILYPYLLNISIRSKNWKLLKAGFYGVYMFFYWYQMNHQGSGYYISDILGVFR